MALLWPWWLLSMLSVPILVGTYIWMLRRRRKYTVRYSSLSLVRAALPERSRWRQHLPFGLLLAGLSILTAAMTRPVAVVEVPLSQTSIILAIDVSRSMCATDVNPNRLTVAQDAANAFIEEQPSGTRIGIVAFARFAEIVVPPTHDKEALHAAINGFTTSLGTAIGSATLKSLDAIAEVNPAVAPSTVRLEEEETFSSENEFQPDIIVLLTDGANSNGANPIAAAKQAADRGVRIYTIGFGTDDPGRMTCTQAQMGSDVFGGGFGFGNFDPDNAPRDIRRFLVIDEETLQGVADSTGGSYFRAENADQLLEIFLDLPSRVSLQKERIEISAFFALLAALFVAGAMALSLRWNRFP